VLREFDKKRITLTELFCHLWDLYCVVFGRLLLVYRRSSDDWVEVRSPQVTVIDDWFWAFVNRKSRPTFSFFIWVQILERLQSETRYQEWTNWTIPEVNAYMVPPRADFRLDIIVWKYQSTLLHRFGESLDHLRERHYTRHYDRYPLVLPPACTIDDVKRDDRITWQWLHGVSEDEFESDDSVLLEVSPSGEDEENTPPRTPFSESSSEPFDPSSTPESESMVADSVITSIANSGANQGSDDVHMQSASEGRGSSGISGFIVPDDDQNAEDDDEEYGGNGKDKGRDDEDKDEGDDENNSGNGEEPSAGRCENCIKYNRVCLGAIGGRACTGCRNSKMRCSLSDSKRGRRPSPLKGKGKAKGKGKGKSKEATTPIPSASTPIVRLPPLREQSPEIPIPDTPIAGPSRPSVPYRGAVYSSTASHINRLETRLESLEAKMDRMQASLDEMLVKQTRIVGALDMFIEAQALGFGNEEDDADDEDFSSDAAGKGKSRAL
ncbi:hypothetical protein EIP86_006391, partial [Pleurotus ostreatoroseus]